MSREKGIMYEERASAYLKENGFEIIEKNFYSRFGEIDIIAKKEGVLHFVEVKGGENFDPIYAATPTKVSKILKAINFYLLKNNLDIFYCIDVVAINGESVHFVENIAY